MIGEKLYRFEIIDSTNRYVLENHNLLHSGDVVIALEQTNGRGRGGKKWHSPRGGLWFSVVFKPKSIKDLNFYTKLSSVSVVQVLRSIKVPAYLRWPNDVYSHGKKLAGILTEGIFDGETPLVIAVGIGMNVNNHIPDEIKHLATSIRELRSREFPVDEILSLILKKMRSNWKKYKLSKGALTRLWKRMLDIKEGQKIEFQGDDATVYKILPDRLLIKTKKGFEEIASTHQLYG